MAEESLNRIRDEVNNIVIPDLLNYIVTHLGDQELQCNLEDYHKEVSFEWSGTSLEFLRAGLERRDYNLYRHLRPDEGYYVLIRKK